MTRRETDSVILRLCNYGSKYGSEMIYRRYTFYETTRDL